MAAKPITDAQCKRALELFKEHNGNYSAAARALGKAGPTYRHRYEEACKRFPKLAKQLAPEPTIEQEAETFRARETERASAAKLKDAMREISRITDRLKELEWAAKASLKPAQWSLMDHPKKKREHMPYVLTSDFQLGEVIRAEETEAGYGYDSAIFRRRYRRLIDTVIYLSVEHCGDWTFPGVIYSRGGDTISGGIHDELRETDDLTPIEAVELCYEEECAGIDKLADAFGRVDVKTPGAAGNHDRNTHKPQAKKASAHSYDRLIAYMLRKHFRNDKRVHFQTSESFDVYFPIYNRQILLTHGDRMGSRGGTGFVGPMATIMRGAQKVIAEQAALGRHVDEVHHGHFHTEGYMGWILSNGCLPGYSEYAKAWRMRPAPPSQWLTYYHPRRGIVDLKSINLTEA